MAVSNRGTIGISWFDTRDTTADRQYNEFFTASSDGGETFLRPVRVSSSSSALDVPGNMILRPTIDSPSKSSGMLSFSFETNGSEFPDGGDYMGLAADAEGIFHPFWADTRTGSFQAWTAAVKIESQNRAIENAPAARTSEMSVTEKMWPLFDPARYNAQTGIEEIPVRLKNASENTVCKPLIVQVKDASSGAMANDKTEILNSDDGNASTGARFDYSRSLGDFSYLAPGESTEAIVWRVKPAKTAKTFVSFKITVTGVAAYSEK